MTEARTKARSFRLFSRSIRILFGGTLVTVALATIRGRFAWMIGAAGLMLLAAGVFGVAMLTPLFRVPCLGDRLRLACPLWLRRVVVNALRHTRRLDAAASAERP